MDDFRSEIQNTPTADLLLILEDQQELYTPQELAVIREELSRRPENSLELEEAEQQRIDEELETLRWVHAYAEQQRQAEAERQSRLRALLDQGYPGYYEYTVLEAFDDRTGRIDPLQLADRLNDMALDGWRLRCAYTNEVGRNSSSAGFGGFSAGVNATMDQNVLILERFVKFRNQ